MLTTNIGSELSLTDVKPRQPSGVILGNPITTLTRERVALMMLETTPLVSQEAQRRLQTSGYPIVGAAGTPVIIVC